MEKTISVQPLTLYLLLEDRGECGKLHISTEKELVFDIFSMIGGEKVVTGAYKVPCEVLAEWVIKASEVVDLAGLIRMFGGVYAREPVCFRQHVEK